MESSKYLYQNKDALIIQMRPNDRGRYHINSVDFEFSGVGIGAIIDIYFRVVENGVLKTEWTKIGFTSFNTATIAVSYDVPRSAVLEIRFVRVGTSASVVEFKKVDIDATFFYTLLPTPTLDGSIFNNVNHDVNTDSLENNLFKKLYLRGIVPNYIKRADNFSKSEDKDYISLFSTIARFFALIIRFFKRWEHASSDEEILKEILRNNGIQFNETQITTPELQALVQNLYNEISKRGTLEVFRLKGDMRADGSVVAENGEFMRMIRATRETELLMENLPKNELGWCLNQSSPLYRGIPNNCLALDKMDYTNKRTHKFMSDDDLDHVLMFGSCMLDEDDDIKGEGKVLVVTGDSGIGRKSDAVVIDDIEDYVMNVDACMDYEIVVGIKVLNNDGNLFASVEGFNRSYVKLADAFMLPNKSTMSGNFFYNENTISLSKFIIGECYYIRFIVKAYATEAEPMGNLNIGYGNNLCFNNAFVKYIIPTIRINGGSIEIFNYHIRPLVRGTNISPIIGEGVENSFSLGFVQASNVFQMYLRNRNTAMSQKEIADFINRYLISYSGTSLLTFIE